MQTFYKICLILMIVGGINWGLVGLFQFDFVGWLLPRYEEEGKTALVVAVGCTGGHHRSVAVAHALADLVRRAGFPVSESHRDLGRN